MIIDHVNETIYKTDGTLVSEPRESVTAKTADYTILATDDNKIFTNTGSSDVINLTLTGSLDTGFKTSIVVNEAYELKITAAAGETIQCGGLVTKTGGYVSVTAVGDTIEITHVGSGSYIVTRLIGSATVEIS